MQLAEIAKWQACTHVKIHEIMVNIIVFTDSINNLSLVMRSIEHKVIALRTKQALIKE